MFMDERDCVSGVFYAPAYAVGEATKFVGGGQAPWALVIRMSHELAVIEHLARLFVHDRQRLVHFGFEACESFA
jgi:hypothetical protein